MLSRHCSLSFIGGNLSKFRRGSFQFSFSKSLSSFLHFLCTFCLLCFICIILFSACLRARIPVVGLLLPVCAALVVRVNVLCYVLRQSVFSTTAFGLGAKYFAFYEIEGIGVQWENMAVSPVEDDEYSLELVLLMMVFDTLLYGLLTWYIENVHPGQSVTTYCTTFHSV